MPSQELCRNNDEGAGTFFLDDEEYNAGSDSVSDIDVSEDDYQDSLSESSCEAVPEDVLAVLSDEIDDTFYRRNVDEISKRAANVNYVELAKKLGVEVDTCREKRIVPVEQEECLVVTPVQRCSDASTGSSVQIQVPSSAKTQPGQSYKKRTRYKKGVIMPDRRQPRGVGAVERAMRSYNERGSKYIFEPVVGESFDSADEGKEFYNLYSWEKGFGIKCGSVRNNTAKTRQSMQEFVCARAGSDMRCKDRTKLTGCPAMIRLLRSDDDGWYITKHVDEHNHEFSLTTEDKKEWKSHKEIDIATKDMVKYLRENNVPLSKLHCIMGSMFGSMEDIPYTKRSLRAICKQIAREQVADDVKKTLALFRKMHSEDPGFQWSVDPDENGRIKSLIWCSGRNRINYGYFGDVLVFDTTYCTNIYNMPFGLFVGVNNHFQTIIYGGVLMRNETAESFKWVFSEFLSLMGGKAPKTILTDQCKAMDVVIAEVMKGTEHLWCKWHVMKLIREGLGPVYTKNRKFRDLFHRIIGDMLSVEEFEAAWDDMLETYKLRGNAFLIRTYQCREKWGKPWAKGKFCARMTSTQRVESANHMLKRFVPRNCSMNRFVLNYNKLQFDRRMETGRGEHETGQVRRLDDRMWPLERHAMEIYTSAVFILFRREVDKSYNYQVTTKDDNTYLVRH